MKRLLFVALVATLPFVAAKARIINEGEARHQADVFLSARKARQVSSSNGSGTRLSLTLADEKPQSGFYAFNVGHGQGFVIVSASSCTDEILGYSDTGSFDSNNLPDALRAWLDDYRCQIDYLERQGGDFHKSTAPRRASRTSVLRLLSSKWNQEQPFNNNCPMYQNEHAVTGCVPTAMAQLMYYHKFPVAAPAIDGYKSRSSSFGEIDVEELPSTTFDWTKMYNTYNSGEDGSEVAKLMRYCGQAVQVNYGRGGSDASAEVALRKLVELFGYDAKLHSISRSDYYYNEWTQAIYNELAARRPVLLSGQSAHGGHAFICDGYDSSTDMFHINWGWGGLSDGFFRLSLLDPDAQGAGGSISSGGYSLSLSAGIGIRPGNGQPLLANKALTVFSLTVADLESSTLVRADESDDFHIVARLNVWNLTGGDHTYHYGVRLCQGNTVLKTDAWSREEGVVIDNNSGRSTSRDFNFGRGLSNGTYRLEAVYKTDDDTEWQLCDNGDKNYLELTIDGTTLTVNTVRQDAYQLEVQSVSYAHAEVTQGELEEVTIMVKNIGSKPYHGDITFLTIKDRIKESWGGTVVDIDPGQSTAVKIAYTPIRSGTFAAQVYQGLFESGVLLSEDSLTIAVAKATVNEADLSFAISVDNAQGNKILGNTAKVRISITNQSEAVYRGFVELVTYTWVNNRANGRYFLIHKETVPALSTVEVERTVDNLQADSIYSFSVMFQSGNVLYEDRNDSYKKYKTVEAYSIYDAKGLATAIEATDSIVVEEGVVCVDLRGQSTVKEVVANENPNVLYLFDSGASSPKGVTGNVVKGTEADSIRLVDGYDFYCPEAFIAKDIRYSRTFANGTDGIGGWVSLTLPFGATRVSVEDGSASGKDIDWYHGEDDQNKDFWLRTFDGDKDGELHFSEFAENTIEAYTPYIIAVPGSRWGEARNLAGKNLVFSAQNVVVDKDRSIVNEGETFRFSGTLQAVDKSGFWRLTSEGDKFVRSEGTIMPFRAVFTLIESGSVAADTLAVPPLSDAMAIKLPTISTLPFANETLVRLDGTRVNSSVGRLPRGIYITRGKKVILAH